MSVIAIVPARGGSKGVKDKNIRLLDGKPLLQYTLESALQAKIFDKIIVSSDSESILSVAKQFDVVTHKRPSEIAQDHTPTDPVIEDVIFTHHLNEEDRLVLLQPTSPLRSSKHIAEATKKFSENPSARSLVSVFEINNKYLKAYLEKDNFLQPLVDLNTAYTRRQDLPSLYMPNGAIYIFTVKEFLRDKNIPRTHQVPYLMSEADSVDVDTLEDFTKLEHILSARR